MVTFYLTSPSTYLLAVLLQKCTSPQLSTKHSKLGTPMYTISRISSKPNSDFLTTPYAILVFFVGSILKASSVSVEFTSLVTLIEV